MTASSNPSLPLLTPAFVAANRYLGWGEPHRGLWFVGLEEADGWFDKSADEVVRLYERLGEVSKPDSQIDFAALGKSGQEIRYRTARIMSAVSLEAQAVPLADRWSWYHEKKLWRPGTKGFQANLYPLGKERWASWPKEFEDLFGFGPNDRDAYRATVTETRFRRLRARWLEDAPLATICFGKKGWDDCKSVFGLESAPRSLSDGKILVHDAERVVLTHFFAYNHVTEADADLIGTLLRDEWKVTLP